MDERLNSEDESEESKIGNSEDGYSDDGVDDIINELNETIDHKEDFPDNLSHSNKASCDNHFKEPKTDTKQQSNEPNSNEPSRPPGFKNFKDDNISSSHCSTSFARFRKKDIKGFSLINEMTRIIEVGDSLGYDVRGCRKSLKKMIDETKMTKLELFRLKSMWGNYVFDYACSMSRGKSGGIISMWDPNIFVKKDIWCDDSFVIVKGRWKILEGDYFMVNIYGPQEPIEKVYLWRRIEDFMHHNNCAFVLFGDFNEVRFNYERLGSSFSQSQADVFNTFITNNNLIELPMGSRQSNTTKDLSSHEKLKSLKAKIKNWLRDTKSNERRHKEEMIDALKHLDVKIDSNNATDEDRDSRVKILNDIDKLDRLDSLDLQQKSRIKWDIEGDKNSKFFHGIVNQRRRSNSIHGVMNDCLWTTDPIQVKDTFLNFFKEKFELHDSNCDFPSAPSVSTLNENDHLLLEKEVIMEEIKFAVCNCGNNKAPGPDGFTFGFIKRYWEIFSRDIMEFVIKFFDSKKMPLGSNSSFITLIPKVSSPIHVKDYRPISLINVHYKIIAKILANRLAKVVDKIISQEQFAFISGRQILDGPLMLSEMIDWYKKYDVIIITEWNALDMDNIIRILHVFYLASGLKINIHKSNIYGVGVSDNEVLDMANNTGCSPGVFPFHYLGLPIGANMNLSVNWKTLLDKFDSRL
ncbi:RNA-directed DNA polymerase, eukaryota, reverse transcriptase zinc-binding domain protein [Tanacetum coccineum]|uniref:RNA-directed DNA polymerase, eukaryota, reverse transcriptase zinc-binding domain protein n=1 Tax=Tanacetum coccineum TaxID=301880 RepID=A0ABQ5E8J6_9ASTR